MTSFEKNHCQPSLLIILKIIIDYNVIMKFSILKKTRSEQQEHKNVIKIAVIRCIAAWRMIIEAYDQKKRGRRNSNYFLRFYN